MAKRVDHAGVAAILAERGIVGMIEGRTEVGPRALGHRSLLAYPASNEVKDKLNQLKVRQWYRPSAREQNKAKRASAQTTDQAGARAGRGGGPRRRRFRAYQSSSFVECGGLWRFVATNARAWVATQRDTLQHSATRCSTARHVAAQRDTLQHSATRCNTARHVATQCVAAEAVGRWTLLAPV
jgi:hypothetical protein